MIYVNWTLFQAFQLLCSIWYKVVLSDWLFLGDTEINGCKTIFFLGLLAGSSLDSYSTCIADHRGDFPCLCNVDSMLRAYEWGIHEPRHHSCHGDCSSFVSRESDHVHRCANDWFFLRSCTLLRVSYDNAFVESVTWIEHHYPVFCPNSMTLRDSADQPFVHYKSGINMTMWWTSASDDFMPVVCSPVTSFCCFQLGSKQNSQVSKL